LAEHTTRINDHATQITPLKGLTGYQNAAASAQRIQARIPNRAQGNTKEGALFVLPT